MRQCVLNYFQIPGTLMKKYGMLNNHWNYEYSVTFNELHTFKKSSTNLFPRTLPFRALLQN